MTRKPNRKRKGRSLQRAKALDVLYEADVRERSDLLGLLAERQVVSTAQQPIGEYGSQIITAYAHAAGDVDSMIEAASPAWSIARMSVVDRNLLRVGTTEIMFLDVPVAVVVSEIKSLCRDLSSDESVPFTMGVLNRIGEIRAGETAGAGQAIDDYPLGAEFTEPRDTVDSEGEDDSSSSSEKENN